MKKYIKIVVGIILVAIVGTIYCAFWGNPVEYLIAKNSFEKYIDKHYKNKVKIDNITYNFKTNNFVAHIKDVEKTQNTSYLDYLGKYGIGDGYYYDTMFNMQDEINNYILYNIEKETGLFREYMSIDSSIDIEMYKYRIYDCYSGEEPITLDLQLHEVYDFEKKENRNYDKDKFPYKNEDKFL
ncbi:YfjL-like protein, partial [Intestinibacter sp.]